MIEEKLQHIGLKDKEVKVYLTTLEHRRVSASMLARLTDLKRSTAYTIAEELADKGLLDKDDSGYTTYYVVSSTQSLVSYIEKQKRLATKREKEVLNLLPELELIPKPVKASVPRVQYVEGEKKIEEFLYKQNDEWVKSTLECHDKTHYGIADHSFSIIPRFAKYLSWSWSKMPKEVDLRIFLNPEQEEVSMCKDLDMIERRNVIYWNAEKFEAGQWVMGDYILNTMTSQKPYHVFQIYDPVLAESLRKMYRELWRLKSLEK